MSIETIGAFIAKFRSYRLTRISGGATLVAIVQRIYQKHSISRQAELVRLVLSIAEIG